MKNSHYRTQDGRALRKMLTLLIRSSVNSREQIAEELSKLLGTKVTKRALDSYTCDSGDQNRWPAEYDIAFCEVIGNYSLLEERVARAGFRMIGPEEERLIHIGRAFCVKAEAEKILQEVTQ